MVVIFRRAGDGLLCRRCAFAGEAAGCPGGLEIESAGEAVDVQDFPGEKKTGGDARFHRARVHLRGLDAAGGHELIARAAPHHREGDCLHPRRAGGEELFRRLGGLRIFVRADRLQEHAGQRFGERESENGFQAFLSVRPAEIREAFRERVEPFGRR